MQDEVSREDKYKETRYIAPFDPILCPMCGKEFKLRIGELEIQEFKIHVDQCEGTYY